MLFGAGIYAYVVGAVCGIVSTRNQASIQSNQLNDYLNDYLKEINIRFKLRLFFLQCKDLFKAKHQKDILQLLSPGLLREFADFVNGRWIRSIKFLYTVDHLNNNPENISKQIPKQIENNKNRNFVSSIALRLSTKIYVIVFYENFFTKKKKIFWKNISKNVFSK
eukprot:GSMAST32.ASY1.ANO1.799.1 assembled CDS